MKVSKETQRLLFLGKQLEEEDDDGNPFTLFDYNVKVSHHFLLLSFLFCSTTTIGYHGFLWQVNDLIQLFVRKPLSDLSQNQNLPDSAGLEAPEKNEKKKAKAEVSDAVSQHIKINEEVDCKDDNTGAWFEAKVEKITCNDENSGFDKLTYHVR